MTYNKLVLAQAGFIISLVLVSMPALALADTLTRQLSQGMSGSDVGSLQTFLALDTTIYPQGLVTNYFGPLTFAAVSNFQSRNGIATVGRVGPLTLAAINSQMGGVSTSDTTEGAGKVTNYGAVQPTLSNLTITTTNNSAIIGWNSSVAATARVIYSTTFPFNLKTAASVTTSGAMSNVQSVAVGSLQGATTYYYVIESTDAQGNFSWSAVGPSFRTQ